MSGLMTEMVALLESQAEHFDNLLGLSLEKTDVVVANDVATLQKITALENTIVRSCDRLEKKRFILLGDIATVLATDAPSLTLAKLATLMVGQPEHAGLVAVTARIRETMAQLSQANEQNKVLIEQSLDYIDFTMNVIASSVAEDPGYANPANDHRDGNVFFDAKQ